jgi:hypothetical protein
MMLLSRKITEVRCREGVALVAEIGVTKQEARLIAADDFVTTVAVLSLANISDLGEPPEIEIQKERLIVRQYMDNDNLKEAAFR